MENGIPEKIKLCNGYSIRYDGKKSIWESHDYLKNLCIFLNKNPDRRSPFVEMDISEFIQRKIKDHYETERKKPEFKAKGFISHTPVCKLEESKVCMLPRMHFADPNLDEENRLKIISKISGIGNPFSDYASRLIDHTYILSDFLKKCQELEILVKNRRHVKVLF